MPEAEKNGISVLDAQGEPLLSSGAFYRSCNAYVSSADRSEKCSVTRIRSAARGSRSQRAFATDLKATALTLENSRLRVTVDPHTGCITSLYDKKANFESIAAGGCGNELVAFKDTPKDYDAWNIDADFEQYFDETRHKPTPCN